MRKLIVISFLTLDGVMQSPGASDEDTAEGFPFGGWQLPFFGDSDGGMPREELREAGAFLIGRKTYDIFARYWPTEGKDIPEWGSFMNETKKYVASKTLEKVDWQNSELLQGDVVEAVAKVKKESGGDIYIWGSSDLCQTLMRQKLIDEFILQFHPLALGTGKRLLKEGGPKQDFKLLRSHVTEMGVITGTYQLKR